MKGVDTNVLVRALTEDDPRQSRLAKAFLAESQAAGERVFVSTTALCEVVWTLRSRPYAYGRSDVSAVIERLLAVSVFELESRDLVREALHEYVEGNADFADHLLGLQGLANGCSATVTFDRRLRNRRGFELLG